MTPEEHLKLAREANAAGKYEEAERVANQLLSETDAHEETHANALIVLAESARLQGAITQAQTHAEAALALAEEHNYPSVKSRAWNMLGNVYLQLGSYDKALEYLGKALALHEELGEKSGVAGTTCNIGIVHQNLGSYDQALEYYSKALPLAEEAGNKSFAANITGNIGIVYRNLGSYDKALDYCGNALALHEELGEKSGVARVMGNIGNVYGALGSNDKALEYFGKALAVHEELAEESGVALVTGNIGLVYSNHGSYDKALEYLGKALALHEELGEKLGVARVIGNIGRLYAKQDYDGYEVAKAEEYLLKAIAISEEIGYKHQLYTVFQNLAKLYEHEKRWEEAHNYFKKFHELKEEVHSEEATKQASLMEQQKQIAEREKEIELAKAAAAAKLNATTQLLHKVLPESIATRMIGGEAEIADYFPQVSILFADIAGFTPISADMPAFMVVRFLNFVFKEFDRVIKKHGCEKIKTIGDGYMAVCGAPIECADHAERIAAAALEMQESIHLPDDIREYLPEGTKFGVRVGLHTGSVVAGVIGEERFVWDIYSDAVNTAARMESHGEADKIHVSNDFVRHLQNRFSSTKNTSHGLTFKKRGEMDIKGKGMMRTYFLEKNV